MTTPGDRIRAARAAAGLTRRQLADALGVSYQRVANMEDGQRVPSLETLHRVAAALACRPCDLDDRLSATIPKGPRA